MKTVDIGWLAGIIEGEGCIGIFKNGRHTAQRTVTVAINMTDFDVVRRLQSVTGIGNLNPKPPKNPIYKPQLNWKVAKQTDVLQILYTVWPLLGERKQAAATEAIKHILAAPGKGRPKCEPSL